MICEAFTNFFFDSPFDIHGSCLEIQKLYRFHTTVLQHGHVWIENSVLVNIWVFLLQSYSKLPVAFYDRIWFPESLLSNDVITLPQYRYHLPQRPHYEIHHQGWLILVRRKQFCIGIKLVLCTIWPSFCKYLDTNQISCNIFLVLEINWSWVHCSSFAMLIIDIYLMLIFWCVRETLLKACCTRQTQCTPHYHNAS
jgi:hypothetical protein